MTETKKPIVVDGLCAMCQRYDPFGPHDFDKKGGVTIKCRWYPGLVPVQVTSCSYHVPESPSP